MMRYTVCTEGKGDTWTTNLLFEAIGWADSTPNALVFEDSVFVAFNCGHLKRVRATRKATAAVTIEIRNQVEGGFYGVANAA